MGKTVEQKPAAKVKDPQYLSDLHDLPCCICSYYGEPQTTETTAHHVIHGRGGNLKTADGLAISLCRDHHQDGGGGKVAVHQNPKEWKRRYGLDTDWSSWCAAEVAQLRKETT
jgi:hypothetical protein